MLAAAFSDIDIAAILLLLMLLFHATPR